jgi:hypothetical protein
MFETQNFQVLKIETKEKEKGEQTIGGGLNPDLNAEL